MHVEPVKTHVIGPTGPKRRLVYVSLALGTIVLGLVVHRYGLDMSAPLRDIVGDALWAMMIVWWISALVPRMPIMARLTVALSVSWLVEFSQRYHAPMLDELRRTTLGHLALGSDFSTRDLAAYAMGVIVAWMLELTIANRLNQ